MRKEIFLKKLGAQIVKYRKANNLSQAELAHKIGKDPQSIERVENGKINASSFYLSEVAKGLEISMKKLFDFDV
ncbi:MAG: helix-turn-helix transcriptional regulator [Bacteroidetes bacterium]|nr:helix-turn-helix transcriptional regulator [Bacteroidota bacterium]